MDYRLMLFYILSPSRFPVFLMALRWLCIFQCFLQDIRIVFSSDCSPSVFSYEMAMIMNSLIVFANTMKSHTTKFVLPITIIVIIKFCSIVIKIYGSKYLISRIIMIIATIINKTIHAFLMYIIWHVQIMKNRVFCYNFFLWECLWEETMHHFSYW